MYVLFFIYIIAAIHLKKLSVPIILIHGKVDYANVVFVFVFMYNLYDVTLYSTYYHMAIYYPEITKVIMMLDYQMIYSTFGGYPVIPNLVNFSLIVLAGPLLEEVLFRYILLTSWERRVGFIGSSILTSLLFGFLHVNFIYAFLFSFLMCLIYRREKSLLTPIIIHIMINLTSWLHNAYYKVVNGPYLTPTLEDFINNVDSIITPLFIVICCLLFLIWKWKLTSNSKVNL